jgi:intein-encoded DNA endonuclease-like protein
MYGFDYMYTKKNFKRIVKWCTEDTSNIWYDHLEHETAEFTEIKNIYKQECVKSNVDSAESERVKSFQEMQKMYGGSKQENTPQQKFLTDYKINYGEIFVNPQFHQCFVKQRQQTDRWGRKLLIKPNRKYYKGSHTLYYKYVAQEYLNKLFAVSLLEDQEMNDC